MALLVEGPGLPSSGPGSYPRDLRAFCTSSVVEMVPDWAEPRDPPRL